MSVRFALSLFAFPLLWPSLAHGQSFNIDLDSPSGPGAGTPAIDHGGAASVPGVWNSVPPSDGTVAITDVFDTYPGVVTIETLVGAGSIQGDGDPLGDQGLLLDDAAFLNSNTTFWVISGLRSGAYQIFTYGWYPAATGGLPRTALVTVDGNLLAISNPSMFPGYVQTQTFCVHTVTIGVGEDLVIEARRGSAKGAPSAINGFQIVALDDWGNYCTSAPNSTGLPARMDATGSASLSANDLTLLAEDAPNTPGIFFFGPNQLQVAFGNGFRCVGGAAKRLLPPVTGMNNILTRSLDYSAPAFSSVSLQPGDTLNFQAWFRDAMAGGAGYNLTDGLSVSFLP